MQLGGDLRPDDREQSAIGTGYRANHSETMKMYVGNLPYDANEQDLRTLFGEHGQVTDVHVPTDRDTARPRGFAFVTMDSKDSMVNAIKALDGHDFHGRNLKVNEARPREDRGGGGGGGGGNRGGGGGNRGGGGGGRW